MQGLTRRIEGKTGKGNRTMFRSHAGTRAGRFGKGSNLAVAIAFAAVVSTPALASDAGNDGGTIDERFSPRGIKGSFALGGISSTETASLDEGSYVALRLGYGFNDRVSLWASLAGSEQEWGKDSTRKDKDAATGGLELGVQYTIPTASRVQPYGRVGLGIYSLEDTKSHDAWTGGGLNFAVGADYFFSKHWGVGAEMAYRGFDYTQGRIGKDGDFEDLDTPIDGDATSFALTLTVQ